MSILRPWSLLSAIVPISYNPNFHTEVYEVLKYEIQNTKYEIRNLESDI